MPREKRICGIKLNPINFRHLLLLELIESPLLKFNKSCSVIDLITAIKIFSSKDNSKISKVSLYEKFHFSRLYYDLSYQAEISQELKIFIEESLSFPKVWIKESDGIKKDEENMPQSIVSVTALMSKLNMSEKDAWEIPVCKAAWYLTAYACVEGAEIKVITTEEEGVSYIDKIKLAKIEEEAIRNFAKENPKIKIVK